MNKYNLGLVFTQFPLRSVFTIDPNLEISNTKVTFDCYCKELSRSFRTMLSWLTSLLV